MIKTITETCFISWLLSQRLSTEQNQCKVVFSSSKSSTLNPALNGIYLLMRHMDHYQFFTRPGSWSDLGLVQIWWRSVICASKDIAN